MTQLVNELKEPQTILNGYGMPLKKDETASWWKSFFNNSQLFYLLGTIVFGALIISHTKEWI
jgi:hypothetical protein